MGPCAKQTTVALLYAKDGRVYVGTNACRNPQVKCPRDAQGFKTGEGYHLCRQICRQVSHAEVAAIVAAGKESDGGDLYLIGHTYACDDCKKSMRKAGIKSFSIMFCVPEEREL